MVQGNGEAATAAPARKKRTSAAPKSGTIVVSTNKVVSGEGINVKSLANGATIEFSGAQFESIRGQEGNVTIEVTNEKGKHLIDVLKKFFGGRGTGSPRKSKA